MIKKLVFYLAAALWHISAYAQQTESPQALFEKGYNYLLARNKPYDPDKALKYLDQSAKMGYHKAMNAIGNIYAQGIGVAANMDSAVYWYKAAAKAGNSSACFNLAKLYKKGDGVQQDFTAAVNYLSKGASLEDNSCKSLLAYMYYKGFGTNQNYYSAYRLYKQLAETGDVNAMYFLGLCYRNGYGTQVDSELGKQWLLKASRNYNAQARHELTEELLPENISAVSPHLQQQLLSLVNYTEKYEVSNSNNYAGMYTGFAVYYDWSGKFVSDIQPLLLDLKKDGNSYKGLWKEGDGNGIPVSFTTSNNKFVFGPNSKYTRSNHYSNRNTELWEFNEATLKLGFVDDSVQLSGYVQFYSPTRKEPGKPLQIILKKKIATSDVHTAVVTSMSLLPNPAVNQSGLRFTISKATRTAIQITNQNGSVVYTENTKLLSEGTYTYALPIAGLPPGVYNVHIVADTKTVKTMLLVKQ